MEVTDVQTLKDYFFSELDSLYPQTEINSFFFRLTEHFLHKTRLDIALTPKLDVSVKEIARFEKAVQRLKNHEPIQYIVGEVEFFGLRLQVDKHVLIPRPETEELVEWILSENPKNFSALDIGTGSGCIAIALAKNQNKVDIEAWDVSSKALNVARKNAEEHHVMVQFKKQDIFEPYHTDKKFDTIVSNPPYVRDLEKAEMHPNVLDYEPKKALFVTDEKPLVYYEKIAQIAPKLLTPDGKVFLEINEFLARETKSLFEKANFSKVTVKNDLFGKKRFIQASL